MLAAMGGIKCYHSVTGKTAGAPGSLAHVTTNDNLSQKAKAQVFLESNKEFAKDTLSVVGATATAAAAGSLAVANSTKCADAFGKLMNKASEFLGNSTINGKNVKDTIKNTKVFQKLNSLPTAAKAGIAAGAAALAVALPILNQVTAAKAGYIEAQHEGQ